MKVAKVLPLILLVASCRTGQAPGPAASRPATPLDNLQQNEVGALVRRAVENRGGWGPWAGKTTVAFHASQRRFRPDGSVEETREETVRVRLRTPIGVRIEWPQGGDETVLINNGRFTTKVDGGKEDFSVGAEQQSRTETLAAYLVVAAPFALVEPGKTLEDQGEATLSDGAVARRLRVSQSASAENADTATRTYFFAGKTGRLLQILVPTSSGFDLIELLDDRPVEGIRVCGRWRVFESDASGLKGALRLETSVTDVAFNQALDDTAFAIPPR